MDYYIDDFTEDNYKRLLKLGKLQRQFISYNEALTGKKGIILRHDVDFSVHRAVALSQIENEELIKSTYFIYMHSAFYNVYEKEIQKLIREIAAGGHDIGLHFEPAYYDLEVSEIKKIEENIYEEKKMLEKITEKEINCISYHNPEVGGDWCSVDDDRIGGLINAYGKYLKNRFKYCSDSNGYWRFERVEDVLKDNTHEYLHILLHPVWWQKEPMYPYDRIERSVNGRRDKVLHNYVEFLNKAGRTNVCGKE